MKVPCCLLIPGVGSLPPNFLQGFNYSGYQFPAADLYGVLHNSNFWSTIGEGFFYWTDAVSGQDISLIDGGALQWAFRPSFNTKAQHSVFAIPSNCAAECPTQKGFVRQFNDPMLRLAARHYGKTL